MYYNYAKVMSYNAPINFIIGERGVGKSLGLKTIMINNFLKNGEQFIIMRLSDYDIKELASNKGAKFFADLSHTDVNIDYELSYIKGGTIIINNQTAGYIMPLYAYDRYKGQAYPLVKYILLEEFIAPKHKRVTFNITTALANMYETIARTRNGVKMFCLANALDMNNPIITRIGFKNINKHGIYKIKEPDDTSKYLAILDYHESTHDYSMYHKTSASGLVATIMEESGVILRNEFTKEFINFNLDNFGRKNAVYVLHLNIGISIKISVNARGYYYLSEDFNPQWYQSIRITFKKYLANQKVVYVPEFKKTLLDILSNPNNVFENSYIYNILRDNL